MPIAMVNARLDELSRYIPVMDKSFAVSQELHSGDLFQGLYSGDFSFTGLCGEVEFGVALRNFVLSFLMASSEDASSESSSSHERESLVLRSESEDSGDQGLVF
uniref:Uncharacterized protein n=1 Tax=Fagus sylvatica TaxID=28930 RepID=A0A2N9EEE8_FAGSY